MTCTKLIQLKTKTVPIDSLKFKPGAARKHNNEQIRKLADAMRTTRLMSPIIVDDAGVVLAGVARAAAGRELGLTHIEVAQAGDLTDEQKRVFMIADNRLAELATWDEPVLADELQALLDGGLDVSITGFDAADIDRIVGTAAAASMADEEVVLPGSGEKSVSVVGDFWCVADHYILCADARDPKAYERLLQGDKARMVFSDPPYNVPIRGNVSGLGAKVHAEFLMGSGEMSEPDFRMFLRSSMECMAAVTVDGGIHFVCMDWRHILDLLAAADPVYSELKNLCVWNKTNAGMGAFYRSQHELVFVFKVGTAPHINNFGLGSKGRYRTNVWTYAGVNTFREGRAEDLAVHPTVKPVPMIADAILDCSRRGDIILDPFAGSGSTLLAAHRTSRLGYAIELDPRYVDVCVRRLERETGVKAIDEDGVTFAEHAERRFREAA